MQKRTNIWLTTIFSLLIFACTNTQKDAEESTITDNPTNAYEQPEASEKQVILFFGNSLSAGFGVEMDIAFPALIGKKIDSLQRNFEVINAGLSGETTASGLTRIDWVLNQKIDILVLELGGNDGLRGISPEETRQNLQGIIDKVKSKYENCEIVLAGMQIPPNMGADYTSQFKLIFPELADKNDIHLIPFLLENVGGESELNQSDGIHPNEEGHKVVAENVWKILEPLTREAV